MNCFSAMMSWQKWLVAGLALALCGAVSAKVKVGEPAPDFSATNSQGEQVRLSQYKGQLVVLEWTNHDCPFVRKHYGSGNMQKTQREAAADGAVWLSIISSAPGRQGFVSPEQANQLTDSRQAAPSAVLFDTSGKIGKAYGARTTPHMYIIDPDGKLVYQGGIDSIPSADKGDIGAAVNYVATSLAEIREGKPVSNSVTRPYGCSVKYGS